MSFHQPPVVALMAYVGDMQWQVGSLQRQVAFFIPLTRWKYQYIAFVLGQNLLVHTVNAYFSSCQLNFSDPDGDSAQDRWR